MLAYWYGPDYHTPFVLNPNTGKAASIARNSIEFTSVGSWGVLTNFTDVMVNLSNMAEPANGGGSGATEAYVILRPAIDLNELGHSDTFKKGVLRDITFEMGANLETKNSSYAPSEKTIYIGPKLVFAMPKGFFNVGLHFRKEWNHEGVLGKSESYDPNFNLEPTWLLPFKVGKAHFAFSGFADYNSPKGKDSFGSQTVSEFLVRTVVAVDIGSFLFRKPQLLDLSGGLWYWHNEYGKPSSDPGAEQLTPLIGMNFHLDGASVTSQAVISSMGSNLTFGSRGKVSDAFKSALNVLVVEDDKELAGFVREGLEDENCVVKVCYDGGSGLRQAELHAFDIILLDVMLPVLNGFEVTKRLRMQNVRTPILCSLPGTRPKTSSKGLTLGPTITSRSPLISKCCLRAFVRALELHRARMQHRCALPISFWTLRSTRRCATDRSLI